MSGRGIMLGRLPPPTGDPRRDAVAELRWSTAGEGLTADKLRHMPTVMRLPTVREAVTDVPHEQRFTAAHSRIAETAATLGEGQPFAILRTALGFGPAGQARNLTARRRQFAQVGTPRTVRDIERRMIEALVTALGGLPDDDADLPPATMVGTVWNVPVLRDPYFVGRDELLDRVRAALGPAGAAALAHTITQTVTGLGGIGKTALAAEFAYRHASDYDVVWWLRAEEPDTLAADVAALATGLDLPAAGSLPDAVEAARNWLASHDRWLLIFDNARQPADVTAYVPGLRGHVLVTSRNPHWSEIATTLDVPPLPLDVAAELIRHRTGLDDADGARLLASKLGGVPKVIEVAAGMFTRGAAVSLTRFAKSIGDGSAATRGVWDSAFDQVLSCPGALEVLGTCAVLNPDEIQPELLLEVIALPDAVVDAAIGALRAQQILRNRIGALSIHRLVQAAARERIGVADVSQAARRVADSLIGLDTDREPERASYARRVQSHTPYLLAALGDGADRAALLRWYTRRLAEDGAYGPARSAAERAVAASEMALGRRHEDTGRAYSLLARVLQDLGELASAKDAAAQALAITEAALGPDHPDTGHCHTVLARILRSRAELPEARDHARRALAITETALGTEHPDTAWRLTACASILRESGQLAEARQVAERAVAAMTAAFGPDHADTGWSLGVLAATLHDLGELTHARHTAERALAVTEAALGREHPDLGWYYGVLGRVLLDLGEVNSAERAANRALAVTETALGSAHPNVGWDHELIARVLAARGKRTAARRTAERAVTITENTLGPGHPATGERLATLAEILRDLGDTAGAEVAAARAVDISTNTLGLNHPLNRRHTVLLGTIRATLATRTDGAVATLR